MEAPPLILENLEALTGEDPYEFLADMLPVYMEDTPLQLEALDEAIKTSEIEVIERVAHTVKTSSAWVGAEKLSSHCLKLELLGRNGDVSNITDLVEQINGEYARVIDWVKANNLV